MYYFDRLYGHKAGTQASVIFDSGGMEGKK